MQDQTQEKQTLNHPNQCIRPFPIRLIVSRLWFRQQNNSALRSGNYRFCGFGDTAVVLAALNSGASFVRTFMSMGTQLFQGLIDNKGFVYYP